MSDGIDSRYVLGLAAALNTLRDEAQKGLDHRNRAYPSGDGGILKIASAGVFYGCPPSCLRFIIQTCKRALEAETP